MSSVWICLFVCKAGRLKNSLQIMMFLSDSMDGKMCFGARLFKIHVNAKYSGPWFRSIHATRAFFAFSKSTFNNFE